MNWSSHLTYETARSLHEERVARLSRSWAPLRLTGLSRVLRRQRRTADRYDLAA